MNPTKVKDALRALGVEPSPCKAENRFPTTGLAFVQFCGPWDHADVFVQYGHTHWIAVREDWVYDVNDGWSPRWWWETRIAPILASQNDGNGTWYIRTGYDIEIPGG